MSKKVLIRKNAGATNLQYFVQPQAGQGGFMQDLAAARGGVQTNQGYQPTPGMVSGAQRFRGAANLLGRGLAAGITGLQTAYGLQGGNVGSLASARDTYQANVGGLTDGQPTDAQRAANMQDEALNQFRQQQEQELVNQQMQEAMGQEPVDQSGSTGTALPGSQSPRLGDAPVGVMPVSGGQRTGERAPLADPSREPNVAIQPAPVAQPAGNLSPAQMAGILPSVETEPATGTTQTTMNQFTENPLQTAQQEEENDPRTERPTILRPVTSHTNPYTAPYTVKDPYAIRNSFTQMIFNEFDDVLHKADPHVAGLLAFRVYMDKFMR